MTQTGAHRFLQELSLGGPLLLYAALIYFLSSLPSFPETVPSFFGFDKIAHFVEYFIFGLLLCRWLSAGERRGRRLFGLTLVIGTLYAASDEWHQSFVPGRDASLFDLLFDAIGIAVAAAIYPSLRRKMPPQQIHSTKKVTR